MYKEQIDQTRIPRHVAIIMDGNGRWAKAQGQERTYGHAAGAQRVHEIMESATRLGLDYLTLYTFSTENWNRPEPEVQALLSLILQHLDEKMFMDNDVRFTTIGDIDRLPAHIRDAVRDLEVKTRNNTKTCMVIAFSYSSKWEIIKAVGNIAQDVKDGKVQPGEVDEELFTKYLETYGMPDPELLIRTGGEERLSNFLLWQCAYSEFYFTPVYWPDFDEEELCKAIVDYQHRQRRFGKTGDQVEQEKNK